MARAKITHSTDSVCIIFKGDKKQPEPSTGVIRFPGGHIEVSRTSDGGYWAHIEVDKAENIKNSRIDYDFAGYNKTEEKVPDVPHHEHIKHIAIKIKGPHKEPGMV